MPSHCPKCGAELPSTETPPALRQKPDPALEYFRAVARAFWVGFLIAVVILFSPFLVQGSAVGYHPLQAFLGSAFFGILGAALWAGLLFFTMILRKLGS